MARRVTAALGVSALLTLAGTVGLAQPAAEQESAGQVRQTVDETVQIRQDTQQEQDAWEAERTQLIARYRAAKANVTYLQELEAVELTRVDALESRVAELERRLAESARLEASLQDTLVVLLRRLETAVAGDLPFLPTERETRLASLQSELARPDVSGAEKLRRLLEALQIEAQFGGTVEVYQDRIAVAGDTEIHVDILRLGRLALLWMTPDGSRVGTYDLAQRRWVELPRGHLRTVREAMEMASRMRPVEIVDLPLGKVAP